MSHSGSNNNVPASAAASAVKSATKKKAARTIEERIADKRKECDEAIAKLQAMMGSKKAIYLHAYRAYEDGKKKQKEGVITEKELKALKAAASAAKAAVNLEEAEKPNNNQRPAAKKATRKAVPKNEASLLARIAQKQKNINSGSLTKSKAAAAKGQITKNKESLRKLHESMKKPNN